ncbi:MAG: redoxin domain-containing protein [Acidimicrobiia bacterium]
MADATVLVDHDEVRVQVSARGDSLLLAPADFAAATGWELKPEGLCQADACVPTRALPHLVVDGNIDLAVAAEALRVPAVIDADAGVAALGTAASDRAASMHSLEAPDFTLPDMTGNDVSLSDFAGRKRVVVTWASWCGCRHDLPVWQALRDELEPAGLEVIAIALDDSVEAAKPWVDEAGSSHPTLLDREQIVPERYGIVNVPSTVWIDEDGCVVRPPAITPGDDTFKDFTRIESQLHHDALRRWVKDDELPMAESDVQARQKVPDDDVQLARLERRVAAHLLRTGNREAAERHFARAFELAPMDWTIRRGSMPLRGEDPFGTEFFAFYQSWEAAGRPDYES